MKITITENEYKLFLKRMGAVREAMAHHQQAYAALQEMIECKRLDNKVPASSDFRIDHEAGEFFIDFLIPPQPEPTVAE